MFQKQTVFVIGAGASTEFKLPAAAELAEKIHAALDVQFSVHGRQVGRGDELLYNDLRAIGPGIQAACWKIRDGILSSNSIDDFLDRHPSDTTAVKVAKAAITKTILAAEANSLLAGQIKFDPLLVRETWLPKLVKLLGTGAEPGDVFKNVRFISFNYDRCVERVLGQMVSGLYAIKSRDVLVQLNVVHPYGSIGSLDDQEPDYIPFGGQARYDYGMLGSRIYTYTEQLTDPNSIAQIRSRISWADQIVFLGFGFHKQNMELLGTEGSLSAKRVYATMYGVSEPNADVMHDRILALFDQGTRRDMIAADYVKIADKSAADFLNYYSLPLTS